MSFDPLDGGCQTLAIPDNGAVAARIEEAFDGLGYQSQVFPRHHPTMPANAGYNSLRTGPWITLLCLFIPTAYRQQLPFPFRPELHSDVLVTFT